MVAGGGPRPHVGRVHDLIDRFTTPRSLVTHLRLAGTIGLRAGLGPVLAHAEWSGAIEAAFRPRRLAAVALTVNSPGGAAAQSFLIADHIRTLADRRRVPVIAYVEDVAASGGLILALAADEVVVQPTSIVGSIGVVSAGFGFHEAIGRLGIERRVHTAGSRKSILDPFRPEAAEDVAMLEALQRDIHARFIDYVRTRRGDRLNEGDAALFDGEVWTGARAVALGLADRTGARHAELHARFGPRVKVRDIGPRRPILSRLSPAAFATGLVDAAFDAAADRAARARLGL